MKNVTPIKIYIILCAIFLPSLVFGQKWVADTLVVSFGKSAIPNCTFSIGKVFDSRSGSPDFLSIFEHKKWLYFPVDQVVVVPSPLAGEFSQKFIAGSDSVPLYGVNVARFVINKKDTNRNRNLSLLATLEVYNVSNTGDSVFFGTFYYEQILKQKKKEMLSLGYEQIIDDWARRFVSDIVSVDAGLTALNPDNFYHFRRGERAVNKNLYASVEMYYGFDFYGCDAELWFSEPEDAKIFQRNSGVLRFVNYRNSQAVALGRQVKRWNYRFSNNWLFTNKVMLLLGINRWKDHQQVAHKFEEIFLFDASMSQQINYNKLDETGFVFGVGLVEDLHYVIHRKISFNIGLSFNCAYKF